MNILSLCTLTAVVISQVGDPVRTREWHVKIVGHNHPLPTTTMAVGAVLGGLIFRVNAILLVRDSRYRKCKVDVICLRQNRSRVS
ncbi:hypothetical protein VTK73DRAFT_1968 [Phialemonium thermophilum]|uniref:Uncharacterized protein n=1 Tax=Phialemonium thermophilum TaxID=223376 RepID=A0ABR3VSU0_9PEZI